MKNSSSTCNKALALQFAVAFLLLCGPAAAQIFPVTLKSHKVQVGSGALVLKAGRCAVLTAAHTVSSAIDLTVGFEDREYPAQVEWNGLQARESIDIAIIKLLSDVPVACKPLAEPDALGSALAQPVGQVWAASGTSEWMTPNVSIVRRNTKDLGLRVMSDEQVSTSRGISGAPVVYNGLIVGVVTDNDRSGLVATRVDNLLRIGGDRLGLSAYAATQRRPREKYSIDDFPEAIRVEVLAARAVRAEAEKTVRLALDVEKLSDEAERTAQGLPLGETVTGVARFSTDQGGFYAGQVQISNTFFSSGSTLSARGYGVSRYMSGEFRGDLRKCLFPINAGCDGPGVWEFVKRENNSWRRIEAEFSKNLITGPAKIFHFSGHILYVAVSTTVMINQNSFEERGPGVMAFPDGRLYEGRIESGRGEGLGAIWNADGSLIRYGKWEKGVAVD